MARRYVRDNRGRFASVGATARGGRLRTEAGNKRATQTRQLAANTPSGTVKGKVKRDPGAAGKAGAAKPANKRVLVKANARPENLFSRATKSTPGYGTDAKANVANARRAAESAGASTALKSNKRSSSVASVNGRTPGQIDFNASHSAWADPRKQALKERRVNLFSTAKGGHTVAHELGHIRHNPMKMANSWEVQLRKKGQIYADADKVVGTQRLARRVSNYARKSPAEFTAETRAALSLGKKYDSKVMGLYREVTGERLPSVRSQQRRQGVTGGYVSPRARRRRKP
jgi:hypothetical protein